MQFLRLINHMKRLKNKRGKKLNKFTMKLHGNGWLVKDFLEYWGISRKTYERISNDPKRIDELDKKIAAMGVNDSER